MARPTTIHVCSACGHAEAALARAVPGLRRVEHARRGARAARRPGAAAAAAAAAPARGPRRSRSRCATSRAERRRGCRTGHRRARPRPRRRPRARLARAARRLAGHRQVDADRHGARATSPAPGRRTLYVSGEESAAQIRLRAERLGRRGALDVPVLAETDLDAVLATLEAERPEVCVIDSVQTLHAAELTGAPGSVGQVREVAAPGDARRPRRAGIAVLLVGHVTKEGALAGPARARAPRRLRAAVRGRARAHLPHAARAEEPLRLDERGRRVRDAPGRPRRGPRRLSARFVGEATRAPGCVVLAAMEGSRPLLVEVQALVSPSELVPPRRVANGIDRNRLALVLAVLGRHAGVGVRHRGRLRQRRRRRARRRAGRRPRGRARGRLGAARRRAGHGRPRRWPASASSGSPASCAPSPTPTAASRRPRSSACATRSTRDRPARCAMR